MVSRPYGAGPGGPENNNEDDAEDDQPLNPGSVPEGPVSSAAPEPRSWSWADDPHADDPFVFEDHEEGPEGAGKSESERAEAILESLPVGVIVFDGAQNLRYANREHAALLGLDLADCDGIESWLRAGCRDAAYAEAVIADWREHIWQKQVTRVFSLKNAADQLREIEFAPRLVHGDLLVVLRDVTESRQAEDALRSMELKFGAVFLPAETGIALVDRTGRFLDANPAFERLVGHSRGDLRRMALSDCVAFSDIERIRTAEARLESTPASESGRSREVAGGAVFAGDEAVHLRPREGDAFPAEVTLTVVRGPLGRRLYSVLHVRSDEHAVHDFEESRARSRALLEAIPDLILVLDRDGTVTDLIPASGGDWRGVVADPCWKGRPVAECWPHFAEAAGDRVAEAIESGELRAWRFSERFPGSQSGTDREVSYAVRVAPCEHDGAVAVVMDVTEEAEAREAHARQGLAFRHLEEAIVVTNLRGRITDFNAAAERIFGYPLGEIAGQGLARLYAEPGQERSLNAEISRSLTEHGRWQARRTFYRKDGSTGQAEVVYLPVEESGTPRSLLGIHREVTDRSPEHSEAERMQHRWRNQLQEINGLMSLELPELGGLESTALAKMQARLKVIGRLHEMAESLEAPVPLVPFARALAADLRRLAGPEADEAAPLLEVRSGPGQSAGDENGNDDDAESPIAPVEVAVDFEIATTFGLLFAELALAHFAEPSAPGADGSVDLEYHEGHPLLRASVPSAVMSRANVPVLRALVEQLRGSLRVKHEDGRAHWFLRFPAKR